MRLFLVALLVALILGLNTSAHAATQADVARVVELVKRHPDGGGDYRVSFQNKDGKYTLWYAEGGTVARVLSIWFRPAGGRAVNFSDHEVEGIVDFGVNGKKTRDLTQMQHFDSATNQGENFRPYWQGLYDQAISAALASLARRK
jgi:hypothetical protein